MRHSGQRSFKESMAEIRTDIANATAARSNLHPTTFTDRENFCEVQFRLFRRILFHCSFFGPCTAFDNSSEKNIFLAAQGSGRDPCLRFFGRHLPENDAEMGVAPVGR
jgi:hypothetical protein